MTERKKNEIFLKYLIFRDRNGDRDGAARIAVIVVVVEARKLGKLNFI